MAAPSQKAHFLRGKETTRSSGAIVGTNDGYTYTATRVDFMSSQLTPFPYGANHRNICRAPISVRHRIRLPGCHQDAANGALRASITANYAHQGVQERTEQRWVKSLPELDKNKSGHWSPDIGIWLADGVAGTDMAKGTYKAR